MKYKIHNQVSPDTIRNFVATKLIDSLPPKSILPPIFELITFKDEVVKSSTFDKALTKCLSRHSGNEPVVVVGGNFTQDSRDLAKKNDVVLIASKHYFWTDASYESILTFSQYRMDSPTPEHLQIQTEQVEASDR